MLAQKRFGFEDQQTIPPILGATDEKYTPEAIGLSEAMFFWPVGVGLSVVECCDWERRINRVVAFYRRSQALPLRRARPRTDSEPPQSGVLLCCPENNVGPEGSGSAGARLTVTRPMGNCKPEFLVARAVQPGSELILDN